MKDFLKTTYDDWQEGLCQSTDPLKRIEYMQQGLKEDPSEKNTWHMHLLKKRYADKKGQISKADFFMAGWMDIKTAARIAKLPFSKKRAHALLIDAADRLLLTQQKASWEDWQIEILHSEYEHLIKYYISLCQDDRTYTGLVMGFISMKDDKVRDKLIKDIKDVVVETPEKMNETALFIPLKKALDNII